MKVNIVSRLSFLAILACSCAGSNETSPPIVVEEASEPMQLEHPEKAGPQLKMMLMQESVDSDPVLNIMAQSDNVSEQQLRKTLSDLGVDVRTVAGDVLTLTIPATQLQAFLFKEGKLSLYWFIELFKVRIP